jgi:hypothetical protein
VGGIILVIAARRRHEPDPDPQPAESSVPEPVDHERLLAEALSARTGRHVGVMDDGQRPAWLRRLEPAAGRPLFHDPDVDDNN